MGLRKSLAVTRDRGLGRPWSRTEERFAKTQARSDGVERVSFVSSFLSALLKKRLVKVVAPGQLSELLGPTLVQQLVEPQWAPHPLTTLNLAIAACILDLDGTILPEEALATLAERLRADHKHYELPQYPTERGLCGIYFGLDDVWQAERPAPYAADAPFVPGEVFGGNVKGLMTYLGSASLHGASFDDVRAAVDQFLTLNDGLSDAGFIRVETLVLVGAVVGRSIAGFPKNEVLDWFGAYVCWATGLDDEEPPRPSGRPRP